MMKRLLLLRVPIYAVLHVDSVTKQSDKGRLDMKDSTWKVMEEIVPILEAFLTVQKYWGRKNLQLVAKSISCYIILLEI